MRYGSRLAGRLNRNWYALYVQTPNENPEFIDARTQRQLSDTLTLARRLGATVFTYKGEDVVETILRFAREYRIGHVVIGRPAPPSGFGRLFHRPPIAERLIAKARGLAVVVADNRLAGITSAVQETEPLVREALEDERPVSPSAFADASFQALLWRESLPKEDAYRKLLKLSVAGRKDLEESQVWTILRKREAQGSTYLAENVALPHARIHDLPSPILTIGIAPKGIIEPETGRAVQIIFLLLSPSQPNDIHVRLLAELASMARDEAFLHDVAAGKSEKEIVDRIRGVLLGTANIGEIG